MSSNLASRLAIHFRQHAGVWIDGRELSRVAGVYAWRTRTSELRKPPFSMRIENRQRRLKRPDGTAFTVSEYRYASTAHGQEAA